MKASSTGELSNEGNAAVRQVLEERSYNCLKELGEAIFADTVKIEADPAQSILIGGLLIGCNGCLASEHIFNCLRSDICLDCLVSGLSLNSDRCIIRYECIEKKIADFFEILHRVTSNAKCVYEKKAYTSVMTSD